MFWFGWGVLFYLPAVYAMQVYLEQNLPQVEPWKWAMILGAVLLIYFSRNRDDVLKHHVV
jgi:hypothetical protein